MIATPNYGFKKPGSDDFYNIDDHNYNADKIDSQLKTNETSISENTQQIKVCSDGVKENKEQIGDLPTLGTVDKSNLVRAINEVNNNSLKGVSIPITSLNDLFYKNVILNTNLVQDMPHGIGYGNTINMTSIVGNQWVHQTQLFSAASGLYHRFKSDTGVVQQWKQLATTEKTEILFPYASGYSVQGDHVYNTVNKVNNIIQVYINVKRSDGGKLTPNQIIGTLPVGYRPLKEVTAFAVDSLGYARPLYITNTGGIVVGIGVNSDYLTGSIWFYTN